MLKPDNMRSNLVSALYLLCDFGQLHNCSVPQFSHLGNEDKIAPTSRRSQYRLAEMGFLQHVEPYLAHRKLRAEEAE